MSNANHTSWHFEDIGAFWLVDGNGDTVMHLDPDSSEFPAKDSSQGRLIAAAPELLEALKAADRILYLLADEISSMGCGSKKVPEMVKAAIAKAEGAHATKGEAHAQ